MDNAVLINNINKSYGKKQIFKDFSLSLPAGRVIGILGENGIGKTTLLKMIADLAKPDSGTIEILGQEVSRHTRDLVSFLIESSRFEDYMKVSDTIRYFEDFFPDFDKSKADELCRAFEIETNYKLKNLSKGARERVCLMLCLARRAQIYVLDEPMAGFDPKFKRDMVAAILTHVEDDQTLIISTHMLRDMDSLFDEIIILTENGAIIANADEIRESGRSLEDYYMEVIG